MKKDRIPAEERLSLLFDDGIYTTLNGGGVITAVGALCGRSVYAFAENNAVRSGGIDKHNARKLVSLYKTAVQNGTPIVGIYDSNGGDITAPGELLSGYADIARAAVAASGVVPVIAVIAGVCGGIAAVTAASADFVIADKHSEFFLTPPFLACNTLVPDKDDGGIERAAAAGNVNIVADNEKAAVLAARRLVSVLPDNNIEEAVFDTDIPEGKRLCEIVGNGDAKIADVKLYRDELLELAEDVITVNAACGNAGTYFGDCGGRTVGFVTALSNRGGGGGKTLTSDDCAKIARFVGFCDCYAIPVVTILDVTGAASDNSASVRDFARLTQVYCSAATTKITVIKGSAIGAAAVVLGAFCGTSDFTIALTNAVIAPVSVAAAAVLNSGDVAGADAYAAAVTAENAAEAGLVSVVVSPGELAGVFGTALDITKGKRATAQPRRHVNSAY